LSNSRDCFSVVVHELYVSRVLPPVIVPAFHPCGRSRNSFSIVIGAWNLFPHSGLPVATPQCQIEARGSLTRYLQTPKIDVTALQQQLSDAERKRGLSGRVLPDHDSSDLDRRLQIQEV
jgi:hypothetical protein